MTEAPPSYRVDGVGPPLVLLNGGLMTYPSWGPVVDHLVGHFQIVRSDFKGQLLNPGTSSATLGDHANDVERLLDTLDIPSAHVVGTSFGALVGVLLAAARPQRVRSLVVITAAAKATDEMTESGRRMRQLVKAAASGKAREEFQDLLVEGVYSAKYRAEHAAEMAARRAAFDRVPDSWFHGLDGILASVEAYDVNAAAREVRCPSLVLAGAGDTVMPREGVDELATALGAEVKEHPTSGHALVVEDSEWLAERCLAFLDGHRGSP